MDTEKLKFLLKKYNDQTASPEEIRIVEDWYERVNGEEPKISVEDLAELKGAIFSHVEKHIGHKVGDAKKNNKFKIHHNTFVRAAVFIGLLLGVAYLFFIKPKADVNPPVIAAQGIQPGGDNAILQLANGTKVVLNSVSDGQISNQHGIKVTKTKDGELVYSMIDQPNTKLAQINTVSTPRGGQYHLILADKTEVWLNAGSSITFPAAFLGSERKVEITGEAYFEVSKDRSKPFIVRARQSEVTVLGTHFNINAYDDEEIETTTLLEGAVRVKLNDQTALLRPGQQAGVRKSSNRINVIEVEDADGIVAWKNGYFQFDGTDVTALMRQISRWYDVDVKFNGELPAKQYTGKIPRGVSVKELIEMLSYSGIHCTISNNKIIVNSK
ncbi:FecR family protein [Pedobacter nyackensis]|uniref:FecR family protein n=1 Tax=Pedobacter nyackensis TaxID=475255 RepID=UPI0029316BE8|nr:FecR domain-containing protein [Pedobacter nyackensis]